MPRTPNSMKMVGRMNHLVDPPGKTRLISALRHLLEKRDFNSITTAEIANAATTNEALIYRYFGSKRGLLHYVLFEYLEEMLGNIASHTKNIDSERKRLEQIVRDTFDIYNRHRVFAKIVLVEVRCFKQYFESDAYQLVKRYAQLYINAIEEGVKKGEFRNDIKPAYIRSAIIGIIEHITMPAVIFGRNLDPDISAKIVCEIVFNGIETKNKPEGIPASYSGSIPGKPELSV